VRWEMETWLAVTVRAAPDARPTASTVAVPEAGPRSVRLVAARLGSALTR